MDLDASPRLLGLAALIALLPLSWVAWRTRGTGARGWLAALSALTLFLTFDLVIFGSFTRLSDSGLGCPDWPGCYGQATPWGAGDHIAAAQAAMPGGPVSFGKAWVEMVHRYLAMTVGALIVVLTASSWLFRRRLPHSPWWPTGTLLWVVVQGLFGKYTVTLKLYPAVVTAHLLGGLVLLALLAVQYQAYRDRPLPMPRWLSGFAWMSLGLLACQIALGGWVSSNYAVLACSGFPQCNGQWWPPMDFAHGFTLLRELGRAGHGGYLPFEALVAIQMVHRLFAVLAAAALLLLAWAAWRVPATRGFGIALLALTLLQLASGLTNVVLGWPLAAALMHSAGAAALVLVMTSMLARAALARQRRAAHGS